MAGYSNKIDQTRFFVDFRGWIWPDMAGYSNEIDQNRCLLLISEAGHGWIFK